MRGPFYSPLRLPDVLLDVARRSALLPSYGVAARAATGRARRSGCARTTCSSWAAPPAELPNAAVVAVSEFYSLNRSLVPQHVVFEIDADELGANTASTLRTLADVRDMGFQLCVAGLGAQFTTLELIAEARPDFLCLDPVLVDGRGERGHTRRGVQLLVRFADRIGAQLIATGVRDERAAAACCSATGWSCSAASSTRARTRDCPRSASRREAPLSARAALAIRR